jgi:hypothetical protein
VSKVVNAALLALFREPRDAARAVTALRASGFAGRDVTVLSNAPYPDGTFGEEPVRHHLYQFALVGAAVGIGIGLLLTIGTQMAYPLVTGGKPILSIPPMLGVIFNLMLLGAVAFTFVGLLFELRLPDLGSAPYDPRISEGYLGVVVTRRGGQVDLAAEVLRRAGAVDIVERPDSGTSS